MKSRDHQLGFVTHKFAAASLPSAAGSPGSHPFHLPTTKLIISKLRPPLPRNVCQISCLKQLTSFFRKNAGWTTPQKTGSKVAAAAVLLVAMGLGASGCAVPLGPGFRLHSRQMVLGKAPATAAPVHVRVADRIENTGNRALSYLSVSLPATIDAATSNFSIRMDGKPIAAIAGSEDPAAPFRVQFDPPWPPKQSREMVMEYDLATDPVSGGVASVTAEGFYLADPHALPFWLTPVGVFANGDVLTRDERFEVTLPADYRIVASGRQQRQRGPDGSFVYRFRTSGKDLPSFVIAGRYQEQSVQTPNGILLFWTFMSLDPNVARTAAERLSATAAAYARLFGPYPGRGPLRIVEAPAGLLALDAAGPGQVAEAASFPEGLLLGPRAFAQGIDSEPILRIAEAELARIWFGWRVPLRSDTDTLLGRGMGLFAVALAVEARGGEAARRLEIERLLAEYDRAIVTGAGSALVRPPEQATPTQLAANALKAALFLADLDDLAGQDKFERSIQRVQRAMAGRGITVALDDLRSALETETGTPMADVFRLWLNRPGIPDDFRARYSPTSPAPAAQRRPTLGYSISHERTAIAGFRRPN